jgi:hypothetical protein
LNTSDKDHAHRITSAVSYSALIISNALPLFWLWNGGIGDPYPLLFLYWAENIVVGLFAILRVLCTRNSSPSSLSRSGLVPLFIVHYGAFCVVHLLFLRILFASPTDSTSQLLYPLLALSAGHLVDFVGFVIRRDNLRYEPGIFTVLPYLRLFVIHVTILACMCLFMVSRTTTRSVFVVILVKTLLELVACCAQRRWLEPMITIDLTTPGLFGQSTEAKQKNE